MQSEFIKHSDAMALLTGAGDYTEAQARIILGQARRWLEPGVGTVYRRAYVEARAAGEFHVNR